MWHRGDRVVKFYGEYLFIVTSVAALSTMFQLRKKNRERTYRNVHTRASIPREAQLKRIADQFRSKSINFVLGPFFFRPTLPDFWASTLSFLRLMDKSSRDPAYIHRRCNIEKINVDYARSRVRTWSWQQPRKLQQRLKNHRLCSYKWRYADFIECLITHARSRAPLVAWLSFQSPSSPVPISPLLLFH